MEHLDSGWLALAFSVLGWVVMILVNVFHGGRKTGSYETEINELKDEVVKLRGLNETYWRRYDQFYKEFSDLRVKVAAFTGDSNGND